MSIEPARSVPWRRCRHCGARFYRPTDHVDTVLVAFCWACIQQFAPQATA